MLNRVLANRRRLDRRTTVRRHQFFPEQCAKEQYNAQGVGFNDEAICSRSSWANGPNPFLFRRLRSRNFLLRAFFGGSQELRIFRIR